VRHDTKMVNLCEQLARIVGGPHVITDPQVLVSFTTDWSGRFSGPALCAVRPADTREVAAVVHACIASDTPMIPQGGNTGLVGGSVPGPSDQLAVIVSTTRLDWVDAIDPITGQVSVGAGVRLAVLQAHARAAGWEYGVDLGARDTATIGGTVATNAGGIEVIANGMTRAQLAGIEAVLPDGSVIVHMTGLMKDNTGFDLAGLLCGSEGSLGVITAARLRLQRPPSERTLALVGVRNFEEALHVMNQHRSRSLLAAEVMDDMSMQLGMRLTGLPYPLRQHHPVVLLLEIADDPSGLHVSDDAVIACDADDRARLWRYREGLGEAYSALGVVHRFDVSVPLDRIPEWIERMREQLTSDPSVETFGFFGHMADGNIHLEVHGPASDDHGIDRMVLTSVVACGGSISAEHGIGRAKTQYLSMVRSASEIVAMQAIKRAWDPRDLMNPGVLFSTTATPG